MAEFSFNIPQSSADSSVFESQESGFYDDYNMPAYNEANPSRLAIMAQLANQNLDGQAEPLESYLGRAEAPDGEASLRDEVDAKETAQAQQDLQTVLTEMIAEGTEDEFFDYLLDTSIASTDLLKRTNLERQTANYLTTSILADENGMAYFMDEEGNVDDDKLEFYETAAAEALLWQDVIQKLSKRMEDQGILADTGDVLGLLLKPLGDDLAWSEVVGSGEGEFFADDIKSAQERIRTAQGKERLAIIKQYTDKFLEMDNELRALSMVDTLKGTLDWRGELGHNAIEILETIDLGLISGSILKAPKALLTLNKASDVAKATGARKAATDLETAMGEKALVSTHMSEDMVDEAVEGVLHSSLKKTLGEDYVNTAGAVNSALEKRVHDFQSVLEEGVLPARLSDDEMSQALLATQDELTARAGNLATDVVDVQMVKEGRTQRVDMFIGSGPDRTGVFITEEAAKEAAENTFNMKPGSFWIKDNGDGFFIAISKEVSEKQFIKPLEDTSKLGHGIPIIKRLMGAASQQTREAHGAAILGQNTASRLQKLFIETQDTIAKLPVKGRDEFLQYAQKMHEEERWMNLEEMKVYYKEQFDRAPTQKDIDAYSNYILANDADYWVRNAKIRKEIVTNGYENLELDGVSVGIAKVVDNVRGDIRTVSIYDAVEGRLYKTGSVTKEKIDELAKSDRFSLVEVPAGYKVDGGIAQYVITPTRHVVAKKLPIKVLNYNPGGHRFYAGEHYLKQQRLFTGSGGQQFAGRPKTLYNFESVADANIAASKMNKAITAFNEARKAGTDKAIRNATEVIQKEMPLWGGYGRMLEMVEDGQLLTSPIEIVRTGKVPVSEGIRLADDAADLSDDVLQAIEQNKFWFQEKRGEHLRTIVDVSNPNATKKAPVMDPLGALDRSINSATRMFGFDDYKARQVEQWMKTYGKHLDTQDGSTFMRFMDIPFAKTANLSATEIEKANAWRDAVKRTIGSFTADEKVIDQSMEGIIDYMDRTGRQQWARRFRDARSKKPITAIKGLVFDHFMALDPSQLFVQLSMLPGVIAVGGANGLKAASSYSLLRLAMVNDSPEVLNRLAKTASVLGGHKPEVFKKLWVDMKTSGVLNVMDTQADIATFGKASTFKKSFLAKPDYYVTKGRQHARFFFNEAERANKGIAYQIAWLENFEKTGKNIETANEAARIAARAEALAGNMTTASRANWQRGVMALPTQFQAHPIRVMELLLTNNAGFSKTDKQRFVAGLGVAYGAGGVMPFGTEIVNGLKSWYVNNFGEQPDETFVRTVRDGMVGGLMAGLEDIPNLDISRLQTFANTDNNILFQALMGKKTFREVMFGPAGSIGGKYMDDIQGALWLKGLFTGVTRFEDAPYLAADLSAELSKNLAGINRAAAAYILYHTGQIKDKDGRPVVNIEDENFGNVIGAALGFPPIEVSDTYAALMDKKAIQDAQQVYAKNIVDTMRQLRDLTTEENPDPEDIRSAKRRLNMWWDLAKAGTPDVQAGAWQMQIAERALQMVGKDEVLAENLTDWYRKLNVDIGITENK